MPDAVLSPEELDEFIAFLNDNSEDMTHARIGKEIEFMERNGLDSFRFLFVIQHMAKSCHSPVISKLQEFWEDGAEASDREAEFARLLHWQLRNHFRREFGLTPLGAGELQHWPAPIMRPQGFPRKRSVKPGEQIGSLHVINDYEAQKIADYVRKNFPDVVKYHQEVLRKSRDQGYIDSNVVGRSGLVERILKASAEFVLNVDHVAHVELVKKALR